MGYFTLFHVFAIVFYITLFQAVTSSGNDSAYFTRKGCWKDKIKNRVFPKLLLTDRDTSSPVSSGKSIQWNVTLFPGYLKDFAYLCSKRTAQMGYSYFGLEYWGECWSGVVPGYTYERYGPSADTVPGINTCVNGQYDLCKDTDDICVGRQRRLFVYEIDLSKVLVKGHNVRLTIENLSGLTMSYDADWYDSGRLADTYTWPKTVVNGRGLDILSYERDNADVGCSGYVNYTMNGIPVTFGFSNPKYGTNKLGVGTNGKTVWDDMSNHDYNEFDIAITVGGIKLTCKCRCTGGSTNVATVTITPA